ncbi:MAG: hypothetical protein J6C64_05070 [Lachnospiraceae bacterium]|nr:hypothetical protein [Lachnospiraceae bacterium]
MMLKKRNSIICMIIVMIVIITLWLIKGKICSFFMTEVITNLVMENENNLNMLVDNLESNEDEVHTTLQISDVEDIEYLKVLFNKCNLQEIFISVNRDNMINNKGTYIFFMTDKNKRLMPSNVEYGFYYTELNEPTRYWGLFPYKEGEKISYFGMCYQYHTEQIKDNWWYYEMKFY